MQIDPTGELVALNVDQCHASVEHVHALLFDGSAIRAPDPKTCFRVIECEALLLQHFSQQGGLGGGQMYPCRSMIPTNRTPAATR